MSEPVGLYVHVPFCVDRCAYCGFTSTTDLDGLARYVDSLIGELELIGDASGAPVATVYVGGGTPSLLPAGDLGRLLEAVSRRTTLADAAEVTAEANPEDVTKALLDGWLAAGVNRVSLGVQSLDDHELRLLGRRHDAAGALRAADSVRRRNVRLSVDIMLGVPGQTSMSVGRTLDRLMALEPHHLSAYLLETDKLARPLRGDLPDDAATADMYLGLHDTLAGAGYEHYEISNFARPGCRSVHNLRYWHREPVHALGVGAHGHDGDQRWANVEDPGTYLELVARGERPIGRRRILTADEALAEEAMFGLRLADGAAAAVVERAADRRPPFAEALADFEHLGLAVRDADRVRLTPSGWLVSSELFAELV